MLYETVPVSQKWEGLVETNFLISLLYLTESTISNILSHSEISNGNFKESICPIIDLKHLQNGLVFFKPLLLQYLTELSSK